MAPVHLNSRKIFFKTLFEPDCSVDSIRILLDQYPFLLMNVDDNFNEYDPPLLFAILSQKSIEIIKELLNRGAGIHETSSIGDTALHYASRFTSTHQYEIIATLMKRGANVNVRNSLGQTPLCVLINDLQNENLIQIMKLMLKPANTDIIDSLLPKVICHFKCFFKPQTKECMTMHSNAIEILKLLLELGATLNFRDLWMYKLKYAKHHLSGDCLRSFRLMMEILIQYFVMVNFNKNLCDIRGEVAYYSYIFPGYDLCDFCDGCMAEITQMKKDKISKCYTMFKYMRNSLKKTTCRVSSEVIYEVLLRIIKNKYPFSKDLIFCAIKHTDLIELSFCITKLNCSNIVGCNPDIFCLIANYLSKQDVLNCLVASNIFSNQ